MKKALNIIKKVISIMLLAMALFAVVFTIISVTTVNNTQRSLNGYKFFVVLSDSMSATDFSAGDMIVVKEVDVNTLEKDDIITFYSTDPKSLGEIITHKIREVKKNENGKLIGFETFGTTTNTTDETLAEPTNIIGQYQFSIPKLGYFIQFMKTPVAYIIFVAVPFALIIGHEVYKCFKIIDENKKEKLRLETEAREKLLEEERLKNEQMLKEIEELKRKLAAENNGSTE
jgi:signal peptidase I